MRPGVRRVAVVAASYAEARAHSDATGLRRGARVALLAPTTHPGAIAGIRFDEVVRLTDVALNPETEQILAKSEARLKETPTP